MANRTSNSIKNAASGIGLKLVLLILQFVGKTFFVRNLDIYLGINSLLASVLSYLNITELGIGAAINFAMYKPIAEDDEEKVRQYIRFYKTVYHILGFITLGIAAVLAAILPSLFNIEDVPFGYDQIYIIFALYVLNAVFGYFIFPARGGFLNASQKDYRLVAVNIVSTIISTIFQIIAVLLFPKSFLGFACYVGIPIVINILASGIRGWLVGQWYPYIKKPSLGRITNNERKELFKNTFGLAIDKFCKIINNSVDSIIISSIIGIVVLGKYSLYFSLVSLVNGFVSTAFSALIPSIGNMDSETDVEHKYRIFNEINFISVWITGFCAISYLAIIQPFMTIWAGSDKLLGFYVPLVVALNFLTEGMMNAVSIFRSGCGLYYKGRYRPIYYTIANIFFSILIGSLFNHYLGEVWGIFGIVMATIVSRFSVMWWFDAKIVFNNVFHTSPKLYLLDYLRNLLITCCVGVICCGACSFLQSFNNIIRIMLSLLICAVLVNGSFYIVYSKRQEYGYLKKRVILMLRRRA